MGTLLHLPDIPNVISSLKAGNKKIVLVGGCFDILHEGHNQFLKKAKETGDILIVMLESDTSVKNRKGEDRPRNNQDLRAHELLKLPFVDLVIPLPTLKTDRDYYEMTNSIEPDIIAVTKNDSALNHKKEQAKLVGGQVVEVIERLPNLSTTDIINSQSK